MTLQIGNTVLRNRLIIGSGKYKSLDDASKCIEESQAEMITVAIRRTPQSKAGEKTLWDIIPQDMHILPNTAGCYTVDDCIRTAMLARELLGDQRGRFIKVEVIGDEKTLYPDVQGTIDATAALVKEGFICMPYISNDPIACMRLIDVGAHAVMPLASPIGSGLGIANPYQMQTVIEVIREHCIKQSRELPIIIDAGVGVASDASIAMEMGVDGVLVNTAIACAHDAPRMARAIRLATEGGREAYLAGRIDKKLYASASSPVQGRFTSSPTQ